MADPLENGLNRKGASSRLLASHNCGLNSTLNLWSTYTCYSVPLPTRVDRTLAPVEGLNCGQL